MLTWKGITVWFTDDGETAIGYEVIGSVALCLADPVGPTEKREAALREFDDYCFGRGWIPCLFAAGAETAALGPALGWKAVEVAEDSVMPLDDLEFKGKTFQDVRTAINKAGKQDVTPRGHEVGRGQAGRHRPAAGDQRRLGRRTRRCRRWASRSAPCARPTTPRSACTSPSTPTARSRGSRRGCRSASDGEIVGWTLDLMRRRDQGFRPVMEFMIGASAMQFKEEGYRFMSLSAAPLAKASDDLGGNSDQQVLQKLLDFLGNTLEPYYGFQSLFAFKQKFKPEHHPMYLMFPDSTALAEIGIAVARAYMPDATLWDWTKMSWDMIRPHREEAAHAS